LGPPAYMPSVIYRNVVVRRITVRRFNHPTIDGAKCSNTIITRNYYSCDSVIEFRHGKKMSFLKCLFSSTLCTEKCC